jgi:hypothetical protein
MQKKEVVQLLSYLNCCYQQSFKYPKKDAKESKLILEVWFDFLQYYEQELVFRIVKKIVINHNSYPPQIGEIVREIECSKLKAEDKISAGKAWALVLKAVHKFGYYRPGAGMDSLPETVKKAVEQFGGFTVICHSQSNSTYVRSQFMQIYQNLKREKEEYQLLPEALERELLTDKNN